MLFLQVTMESEEQDQHIPMGPPQSEASKTDFGASASTNEITTPNSSSNPCTTPVGTSSQPCLNIAATSSTPQGLLQQQPCPNLTTEASTPSIENQESGPFPSSSKETTQLKLELGCKRDLKSDVWKHFKRQKIGEEWISVCNYCKKDLSENLGNGTTNLRNHWKNCKHRTTKTIKDIPKMVQKTVLNPRKGLDGKVTIGTHNFDQDEARKELAFMICLHEYPLVMVEHVGFRRFTNAIQPSFKSVSRNTVKKDIMTIYEYEKEKTIRLLGKNKSRIALTTNLWTATTQKKGYMAVTAHWIDDAWVLQSRIIRFIYVPAPHSSKVICNELHASLLEWSIEQKISTVTLDNCNTNNALIDLLKDKLSGPKLLLNGKLLHMRCCAHILNLVVRYGLEVISKDIELIRNAVTFWKATPKRDEMFEKYARQLEVPISKKLVLDCKTRWNSTYLMLEAAIPYQAVFTLLAQLKKEKFNGVPTEIGWSLAKEVCDKLKLFYVVSEQFSGTLYPTANQYFPMICQIKIQLENWKKCGNVFIEGMALRMSVKFDQYWDVVNNTMALASILDPRYKMLLLEFYFPTIYGNGEAEKRIVDVRKFCYELFEDYLGKYNTSGGGGKSGSSSTSSLSLVGLDLSNFDAFADKKNSSLSDCSELDKYLGGKSVPRTEDFDVLGWWKANIGDYPVLSLIARDVLAIPISTVASESAFSTGGRFVSPHRNRLHPKTLKALMCTQDWLWAEVKDICSSSDGDTCRYYDDIVEDGAEEKSCVIIK